MYSNIPEYIQFFPTFRCNQHCTFCFNRGISLDKEISNSAFERIINILLNIGTNEIDILGGEPTLHIGLTAMVDMACKSGMRITISSNGSNTRLLSSLSETYRSKGLEIGISLNTHKLRDELHDYILTYKPLLKGVCTNKQLFPKAVRPYLEVPDITYNLLFLDTPYREDLRNSIPFYKFLKALENLKRKFTNVEGVFCSGFIPDVKKSPLLQCVRCPAGTTKLSIMPDGSVYPCYLFFRHREFRLGNLFGDDFKKMWNNPILDYFRRFEKNPCIHKKCELSSLCHGGCPAMSLLVYGSLSAPEPRCMAH